MRTISSSFDEGIDEQVCDACVIIIELVMVAGLNLHKGLHNEDAIGGVDVVDDRIWSSEM